MKVARGIRAGVRISKVAIMDNWALLESVEGLDAPTAIASSGALWELLQGEKEHVCREISAAGTLAHTNGFAANEREPSDEYTDQIDCRHRGHLEQRLHDIIDAQDRLIDGSYSRCVECGEQIELKRLLANPAVHLCLACQQIAEPNFAFHTL